MGILDRLRGKKSVDIAMTTQSFDRMRDDAVVQVVGEAYRQDAVALARPPSANDLPPGMTAPAPGFFKAILMPQPSNPHDRNAIAVTLWAGGSWVHVGYLSREDALAYRPVFARIDSPGRTPGIECDAATARERGGMGVVLHLGTPGECIAEMVTDDREPAEHPWKGRRVTFTGEGRTTLAGVPIDRAAQLLLASWAGVEVLPRVSKKTELLVVADLRDPTANLVKAKDYGIPVEAETEFLVAIGLPADLVDRDRTRWAR